MKRLIRKAWDKIELYHATSSQLFVEMNESGSISPSGYTGTTSNGQNGVDNESGEQNGVYLGNENVLEWYYDGAVSKGVTNSELPNLPIALKINVDTDALIPDYDDLTILMEDDENTNIKTIKDNVLTDEETPYWKQSLEEIDQVVHNGPISLDQVSAVKILSKPMNAGKFEESDIQNIISENVNVDTWISLSEAISQLENFHQILQNQVQVDTSDNLVANKLKKMIKL